MTVVESVSKATSRRAVLVGALSGIGALAASVIGRADPVRAGVDGDVVLGMGNTAAAQTSITNLANPETVLLGASSSGIAVKGTSSTNTGVWGESTSDVGVHAKSSSNIAAYSESHASDRAASVGQGLGNSSGVQGISGATFPNAKANTGVYGYANQDNTANGVFGESPAGRAVAGYSSSGYAGYFSGRVFTSRWMEFAEVTTPASPSANRARLFVRDSAGKTQLAVKFPNGTVRVLATEA